MSNIIGINGSPKINSGASYNYLKKITNKIINSNLYTPKDLKYLKKSKTIILSFPLYVDSLPSHFLKMLIEMNHNKISNKDIYVILNNGFFEGKQGNIALEIIKNYCHRTNNNYMGGLVIGGGPINYPIICLKNKIYLNKLNRYIQNDLYFNDKYLSPLIPRYIYLKCANYIFKKKLKQIIIKKKTIT